VIRPYLAVVTDSFRSAFASRVLWVALVVIYLFLFAIAPIGYREVFTTTFRWPDFANGTRMKAMLARAIVETPQTQSPGDRDDASQDAAAKLSGETPAGRIARYLPDELQRDLRKVAEGQEVRIRLDIFADGLNQLYESDDWYDAEIWKSTPRLRELREIESLDPSELSEELRLRRARLRIEAALPGVFESRGSRSIALTYAGMDFPAILQIEKAQFQILLNHFVLRVIIDWVLGFAMIFLGILVTAAIIPDMLQPGSLHLLLSKPVSRWMLFLAKFLGGCAFVFVCVTQLIIGLWLIAGLRLDVWNPRLLLCIPVCVFLFSVFYSVSAVAGLKWRSPILAIGLANLFGAACLVIGMAGGLSDGFIVERDRITGLTTAGDTIVAATRGGHLRRFDKAQNRWINLFPDDTGGSDRVIPPITLSSGTVATARVRGGRMNVFGSGATPLLLVDPQPGAMPEPSIELPSGTLELFPLKDGAILAHNSGEMMVANAADIRSTQTEPQASETTDHSANAAIAESLGGWLPKLIKMMGGPSDGFYSVLPEQLTLVSPSSVAVSRQGTSLFVLSGGKLVRLDRPDPSGNDLSQKDSDAQARWTEIARTNVTVAGRSAWVRCVGDCAVVVLRLDEPPLLFSDRLEPLAVDPQLLKQFADLSIVTATACHGADAVAIATTGGQAWVLSTQTDCTKFDFRRIGRSTTVEAMHWNERDQQIWLAHQVDRVSAWDFSELSVGKLPRLPAIDHKPTVGGWRLVDRYVVTPLRSVTPQTGELGETIATIVSGQDSLQIPFARAGETATTQRYNVWRPVLTCGGFVIFMLTLGCVYFTRTDF